MSIKLKGSTAGSVALDAPANTSPSGSDISFTLPIADGSSGQVLTTNGSGALSFANEGKILQVLQTTKTDTFSTSSTSFTDITGLSVSITPSSTSNKIFVLFNVPVSASSSALAHLTLLRGSTEIFLGDAAGSRTRGTTGSHSVIHNGTPNFAVQFLDSPSSTSSVTYKIQIKAQSGYTAVVNSASTDTDSVETLRVPSQITVMEVAA